MTKLQIVLLIALAATCLLVQAEAQQQRSSRFGRLRQRNRYLARQELEEAAAAGADGAPAVAVTPYPTADELKPEIPFEEAAPAAAPIPDEVYGPPELTYNSGVPDEFYGPPEFSDNGLPGADAVEPFPPTLDAETARLVAQRRANLRQRQLAYRQAVTNGRTAAGRPAKLRATAFKRFA